MGNRHSGDETTLLQPRVLFYINGEKSCSPNHCEQGRRKFLRKAACNVRLPKIEEAARKRKRLLLHYQSKRKIILSHIP